MDNHSNKYYELEEEIQKITESPQIYMRSIENPDQSVSIIQTEGTTIATDGVTRSHLFRITKQRDKLSQTTTVYLCHIQNVVEISSYSFIIRLDIEGRGVNYENWAWTVYIREELLEDDKYAGHVLSKVMSMMKDIDKHKSEYPESYGLWLSNPYEYFTSDEYM